MGMGSGSFELTGVFAQITGASLQSTHYCEATQGREGSSCHTAMLLSPSRINLACLTLLRLVLVLCSESNSSVESSREKCLKESGYNVYVRDNDTYYMCDIYKYMIYNC